MKARRLFGALALASTTLALGGCITSGVVAQMVVGAPNGGHPKEQSGLLGKISREFYSQQFKLPVGPPPAKLAVAVIEPKNYGFNASITSAQKSSEHVSQWQVQNAPSRAFISFHPQKPFLKRLQTGLARRPTCKPRGTVILLPGWGEAKETLIGYALEALGQGPGAGDRSNCLDSALDAPTNARYRLTFKLKFKLGNVSANPIPQKITN